MTIIALIVTGYVQRVFTRGRISVVTAHTGAKHLCMVHTKNRCPEVDTVAVFTDIGCQEVLCGFPRFLLTIVTTDAAAGNGSMIEESGYPCITRMAGVALIVTGYVLRMFTGRLLSIMAALTRPKNLCMVHVKYRCPEIDTVAVFTDLGC